MNKEQSFPGENFARSCLIFLYSVAFTEILFVKVFTPLEVSSEKLLLNCFQGSALDIAYVPQG